MASVEIDTTKYTNRTNKLTAPNLKLKNPKPIVLFITALAFIIAAGFVPQRQTTAFANQKLNIDKDIENLKEQLKTLDEENIITDRQIQEFEKKLDDIKKDSTGTDPVKTWQALDHMKEYDWVETELARSR